MTEKLSWEDNIIIRQEEIYKDKMVFDYFNKVWLSGIIEEELAFDHEYHGKKFYKTKVGILRYSGIKDYIPILVPEFLLYDSNIFALKGKLVEIGGQFRSYNKMEKDGKMHLELFVFASFIKSYESEMEVEKTNANLIYLDGYICKKPIFRTTPFGREITDFLIAVQRSYGRSSYIPCIAWSGLAKYANTLEVGSRIELYGRIESRRFFKRLSEDSDVGVEKEINEISINKIREI